MKFEDYVKKNEPKTIADLIEDLIYECMEDDPKFRSPQKIEKLKAKININLKIN